jgi:histidine ammonia-lyase
MSSQGRVVIDGGPLSIGDVVSVARREVSVTLDEAAADRLASARARLDAIAHDGLPHYGVNTGFGSLARRRVDDAHLAELQVNLVRSHAAGVGADLPVDVVRAMMLILAASLARGRSGVRPELVRQIVRCLRCGITPAVPEIGSVGASGDLAPLAHAAMPLIGEGAVWYRGRRVPAEQALRDEQIAPLTLGAKEGLALINGTHLMAAQGCLAVHDAERLARTALVAGAMSVDACRGSDGPFDDRIAALRGHPGVRTAARALRDLLRGSQIGPSHRDNDPRVQDPYSLRCQPQVVGAALDSLAFVRTALTRELSAVTDNPLLVTAEDGDELVSGGNFHGMPIAMALDHVALPITHLAGMAERRVFWMLAAIDPESGLSPYLASLPGLTSGLMIAQYTAAAACNELIGLCTPASVANLSTCAGVEDYNSFGPRSAAKARRAVELAELVVAVELLCAAEALEQHRPLRTGDRLEAAHAIIRRRVDRFSTDRPPGPDIETVATMIRAGEFGGLVELSPAQETAT